MKKLTKIDKCDIPNVQSAQTVEEYGASVWDSLFKASISEDHLSPNVGYWVAGDILEGPEVGQSLKMMRYIRNDVKCPGLFYTSPVTIVDGDYFTTTNSIYKIEDYIE